jgi:5-bromo-4-chloroindolyl phosphate hydrolysis protein
VFDRYGCNKFCLSLFGVLCLTVTAVIGSVLAKFIWSVVFITDITVKHNTPNKLRKNLLQP